jgi:predicted DNA-binding protein YlxM (UPF0122 family)
MSLPPLLKALGIPETVREQSNPTGNNVTDKINPTEYDNKDNPYSTLDGKTTPLLKALGIGVRGALQGVADLIPAQSIESLAAPFADPNQYEELPKQLRDGGETSTYDDIQSKANNTLSNQLVDATNLTKPLTDKEKLGFETTRNAAAFALGGETRLGKVALDATAGAITGATTEAAKQHGAGDTTSTVLGLLAGAATLASGHVKAKYGKNVAEALKQGPLVREDGTLTDLGVKSGIDPKTAAMAQHDADTIAEANVRKLYDDLEAAKQSIVDTKQKLLDQGVPADHPEVVKLDDNINKIDEMTKALDEHLGESKPAAPVDYEPVQTTDTRTSEQRQQEATDVLGVPVSKGIAEQDVHQVAKETDLARQDTPAGRQASEIVAERNQAATDATRALGNDNEFMHLDTAEKGSFIADTFNAAKQAAYEHVKNLFAKLDASAKAPKVLADKVKQKMLDAINDAKTPDSIRKSLEQIAAQYGWVGRHVGKNEFGHDLVAVDKSVVNPEGLVQTVPSHTLPIVGGMKDLTLANAHELEQELNSLFKHGEHNPQIAIKDAIHDAVNETLKYYGEADSKAALDAREAQSAYRDYKRKFDNKDIVQSVTDVKKGTDTPKVNPENIPDKIIGANPKDVSALKKAKARLMVEQGKKAWEVIKAHTIGKIIDGAIDHNTGLVNAKKLNAVIAKLGHAKLKLIFEPKEYNQLMKLQRVVNDLALKGQSATLRETNHLLRMLYHGVKWGSLIFGHGATHAASIGMFAGSDMFKRSQAGKAAAQTLEELRGAGVGAKEAKPETKPIIDKQAVADLTKYLQSNEFSAPLLRGATVNNKDDN